MEKAYLGARSLETAHILNKEERAWLRARFQDVPQALAPQEIFRILNDAQAFERFCHVQFPGRRRFSLEGSESLNVALEALLHHWTRQAVEPSRERPSPVETSREGDAASAKGTTGGGSSIDRGKARRNMGEIALAMTHRGRLNVMRNIFKRPLGSLLGKFYGAHASDNGNGHDDVPYHYGCAYDLPTAKDKKTIRLTLLPNPSHLESITPVLLGYAKGAQERLKLPVASVAVHGNAAFAGQGAVYETLQLARLKHYEAGGTIHIVLDNQVGFTASPEETASAEHCAALGRTFDIPVLHVNGDAPQEVARAALVAAEWRDKFARDVILRIVSYRRPGHNETDDAAFTSPLEARTIKQRPSVVDIYKNALLTKGVLSSPALDETERTTRAALANEHRQALGGVAAPGTPQTKRPAQAKKNADLLPTPPMTGMPLARLKTILKACHPDEFRDAQGQFRLHPKLEVLLAKRAEAGDDTSAPIVDWGTAEILALAGVGLDGRPVRLAGQDSVRGAFGHRHLTPKDKLSGAPLDWINRLSPRQGLITAINSPLSEYAALGFEYGYSVARPEGLTLWEAQFGDFANGAQIVIDQYIASAQAKWGLASNITLLLPHGYEGAGPEHSSARPERFLQLCAQGNLRVLQPSTPAQYFHMLRGQVANKALVPAVILTPKSLLRREVSFSAFFELGPRTRLRPIIADAPHGGAQERVKRIILCSGRIYYDLAESLTARGDAERFVLIRIEQLYPFPLGELDGLLQEYPSAEELYWTQDEPMNMGAWSYLHPILNELAARRAEGSLALECASRPAAASPATGSASIHEYQKAELLERAFALTMNCRNSDS